MKIKNMFVAIMALFSTCFLGSWSSGDPANQLVVGLECNYAPFNWTETVSNENTLSIDGKANQYADGYDIQIAKRIGDYLNVDVIIKKLDWDALIPSLQNGEINAVIAGMTDTEERRLSIDFTDEYYRSELVLVVREEDSIDETLDKEAFAKYVNGKYIQSQISTVTDNVIDTFVEYGAIHASPVDTFATAALDVASKSVDMMTAELPVARSLVAANPSLDIVHIDQAILGDLASELGVSIGVKKGDTDLINDINRALKNISNEERVEIMESAIIRSETDENSGSMNSFDKIIYLLKNYYKTFLAGLASTLILAIVGTIVGLLIGILIALGKNIKISNDDNYFIKLFKGLIKGVSTIYSVVLRGTPMMVQALIFKFGCQAIGINFTNILNGVPVFDGWLIAGLIVITLNTGAYTGEDVRAGLNGLDVGQKEAALSLGMNKFKTMINVVLPQALRNALPTLCNEYIINVKDSSVLNVISVTELFLSVSIATGKNYFMVEGYIIIALIYLTLTLIATGLFKILTNKLDGKKYSFEFFRRKRLTEGK